MITLLFKFRLLIVNKNLENPSSDVLALRAFVPMLSMGRCDNALLLFRWHFRLLPMPSNRVQETSERGESAVGTGVRCRSDDLAPIRKMLYAYTQNTLRLYPK